MSAARPRGRSAGGLPVLLALALGACGGGSAAAPQGAGSPGAPPSPAARVRYREVAREIGIDAVHAPVLTDDRDVLYRAGGAVGDFDRDGDQDLFVVGGGLAADRLFLNRGDGTFEDRSAEWGVDVFHRGGGAAVGDVDGDGWLDLYVTSLGEPGLPPRTGAHRLYRNTGHGRFEEVAVASGVATTSPIKPDGTSAAFGDYDLDGDLDLMVAGTARESGGNRLFRNRGDGTFEDVTVEAGVYDVGLWGFCPRFLDMNGDRYPELLLVADFGTSRYYVNDGDGTFREATRASGTGLDENGMGQAVGDFDGDGRPDWYVTAIASAHTGGNRLYRNLGGHRYEDVGRAWGVDDAGWAWGAVALDADLDGGLDLLVTTGWFTDFDAGAFVGQPTRLFLDVGTGACVEAAEACGLRHTAQGRGILDLDLEGDGDRDAVIFSHAGPVAVYRAEVPDGAHHLRVFLDTRGHGALAPDGIGTRLEATIGGRVLVRWIDGGSSYLSQGELSALFGLGDRTRVDELRVLWNDGRVDVWADLAADQTLVLSPRDP